MKKIISISVMLVLITACSAFRNVARPAREIADALCQLVSTEYTKEQRDGLSPQEWCAIKDHLDPFFDYILSAPEKAGVSEERKCL